MKVIIFSGTFETFGPVTSEEVPRHLEECGFRRFGEDWVHNDTYAYVREVLPMDVLRLKRKPS